MSHNQEYRRILHRMGYYNYQNGLIYRHVGQEGGWDEHNRRCREYIINAINQIKPSKVTILGSGWLLDLPLAEISEMTEEVVLADIVHPPDVAIQIEAFRNVRLLETDVTGGLISEVWTAIKRYGLFTKMKSIESVKIPDYHPAEDPGFVISLNLLTQLENLPVDFIIRNARINKAEIDEFRKNVQKKHMDFLTTRSSVLISDIEEIFTSKDGSENVVHTLRTEIPTGNNYTEWTWDFDLRRSDYFNSSSVLRVAAVTYGL